MRKLEIDAAARVLREELRKDGYFERPTAPVLFQWLAHVSLALGGLAGFNLLHGLPAVGALLVSCYGCLGTATVAHMASHNAASKHRLVNKAITFATYPFFLMLSATYWHRSHVQLHHPAPNVVGVDDDCDLRPMFALNHEHAEHGSYPAWARRALGMLLPLLLPFNGFGMYVQGIQHVAGELRKKPKERQPNVWLDVACMTLHFVVWLGLPMIWFSPATVIGSYVLRVAILGYGLFAILAPGHFPAEASCLHVSLQKESFYARQTATSLNFRTSWLGRFLCAGLEYQIEHHLFPSVSHVHLPAMSAKVRAFCEANGLPYRTLGWGEALWKSWLVFLDPKPVHETMPIAMSVTPAPEPEACLEALGAALRSSLPPPSLPPANA